MVNSRHDGADMTTMGPIAHTAARQSTTSETAPSGLAHEALIYGSDEELVDAVVPFVADGLARSEGIVVVMPPRKTALVREALGPDARAVEFCDRAEFYETPARAVARVHELGEQLVAEGASGMRTFGEVPYEASDTSDELGWVRYEAIVNRVFAAADQLSACAYDERVLPDWILDTAARTHHHLHTDGQRRPSDRYEDPAAVARRFAPPPPLPEGDPTFELEVGVDQLARIRHAIDALSRSAGISPDRACELAVGLNEVVSNAVEHGSDCAKVRCWHEPDRLVCEVADDGPGFDDPFAGFSPPDSEELGRRGLWLARQCFDRVELQRRGRAGLLATMAASL